MTGLVLVYVISQVVYVLSCYMHHLSTFLGKGCKSISRYLDAYIALHM